jgi:hypothetical protein
VCRQISHSRGRVGGRKPKMTAAKLPLAMASMGKRDTSVGALCEELAITRQTLYPARSRRPRA